MQINVWKDEEEQRPQAHKAHMATKAYKLTLLSYPHHIVSPLKGFKIHMNLNKEEREVRKRKEKESSRGAARKE